MFELPNNTTEQVRPAVVSRIVETMFRVGSLSYCDDCVTLDGTPRFLGRYTPPYDDYTKATHFTYDERQSAFEEFKKKGYHIAKEEWYSPVNSNRLYSYTLHETRDTEEDSMFHWQF